MNLFDLILKATQPAVDLQAFLAGLASAYPDAAPQINDVISKLAQAVSSDNLVTIAALIPAELSDIAHGKLDPKDHPSDAI